MYYVLNSLWPTADLLRRILIPLGYRYHGWTSNLVFAAFAIFGKFLQELDGVTLAFKVYFPSAAAG